MKLAEPNHRYFVKRNGDVVASRCNKRYDPKRTGEVVPGIPLSANEVKQLFNDMKNTTLKSLSMQYGISYYHIRKLKSLVAAKKLAL